MVNQTVKFYSISEDAITVEFGDQISSDLNNKVLVLDKLIQKYNFDGFIESVPSYSSLTIFYEPLKVIKNYTKFNTTFDAVKFFIEKALNSSNELIEIPIRLTEIPFTYKKEFAPDLSYISDTSDLSETSVIKIFTEQIYRVYSIGFLPGFAYMGDVDERIATPRKKSPRYKVLKGSVGIAGRQTGIYPFESPGGWQIIGKTDIEIFNPFSSPPTLLKTGDFVKFVCEV